jgi:2-methylcitrate dehydratase PrpD
VAIGAKHKVPVSQDPSITAQLADFLCGTRAEDIPAAVIKAAGGYLLDWLGCAIAGLPTVPGQAIRQHTEQQPVGAVSVLGFADGRSPQVAALHNGAVSHIVEMDDVDRAAVLHPGAVVIPAALAIAERLERGGHDLLAAITLGYEVAIRVGESVGPKHYFHWHNTSTCGVFGASAAAGWLLALSREQMTWALGNAGTQASGLWQFLQDGAMSKHLHAGRAAANGVLAAELAECGFSGAAAILEGSQGFWAASAPDGDPEAVTRGLGEGAWKLPNVSTKPYPSCRHTHSAVDAALWLGAEAGRPSAEQIASLEIDGYRSMLELCDNPRPDSLYAAKFSLQYTAARALLDGHLGLSDFGERDLTDAHVRSVMERTVARLDHRLDSLYPRQFAARLTLTLKDGRRFSHEVLTPKGDPENPLSRAELEAKFCSLLAGTPYEGHAQRYLDELGGLQERGSVRGFLAL